MSHDIQRPRDDQPPRTSAPSSWLVLLLVVLMILLIIRQFDDNGLFSSSPASRTVTPRGDLAADEHTTIELFRNVNESVVFVWTTETRIEPDLFTFRVQEIPSVGTGFIWDKQGHIITNYHVVRADIAPKVKLADESVWPATVVGASPERDIAVLHIDAPRELLQPIPLGSSADLQVGQTVFALGYPFGLNLTLTKGIISGLGFVLPLDEERSIENAIQTDASINPGNSGGPLLDSAGRLIGMNTAIYSPTRTSAGVGFAIPSDTIRAAVPAMIEHPLGQFVSIGVLLDTRLANLRDTQTGRFGQAGVEILQVAPGSPADRAGLKGVSYDELGLPIRGDVLLSLNGEPVDDPSDPLRFFASRSSGEVVTLTILRKGTIGEVDITIP